MPTPYYLKKKNKTFKTIKKEYLSNEVLEVFSRMESEYDSHLNDFTLEEYLKSIYPLIKQLNEIIPFAGSLNGHEIKEVFKFSKKNVFKDLTLDVFMNEYRNTLKFHLLYYKEDVFGPLKDTIPFLIAQRLFFAYNNTTYRLCNLSNVRKLTNEILDEIEAGDLTIQTLKGGAFNAGDSPLNTIRSKKLDVPQILEILDSFDHKPTYKEFVDRYNARHLSEPNFKLLSRNALKLKLSRLSKNGVYLHDRFNIDTSKWHKPVQLQPMKGVKHIDYEKELNPDYPEPKSKKKKEDPKPRRPKKPKKNKKNPQKSNKILRIKRKNLR